MSISEKDPRPEPKFPRKAPRKAWSVALNICSECGLYILVNYGLSCVNLSFWNHPIRVLTFAVNLVVLGKFLAALEKACPSKWVKWAAFAGSVGVVILLVWLVGYFPVSQTPVRLRWN